MNTPPKKIYLNVDSNGKYHLDHVTRKRVYSQDAEYIRTNIRICDVSSDAGAILNDEIDENPVTDNEEKEEITVKAEAWIIVDPDGKPYWPTINETGYEDTISIFLMALGCEDWKAFYRRGYRCKKLEVRGI